MAPNEKDARGARATALALMAEIVARLEEADPLSEWWRDVAQLCERFDRLRVQLRPGDNSNANAAEIPGLYFISLDRCDASKQHPPEVAFMLPALQQELREGAEGIVCMIVRDPEEHRASNSILMVDRLSGVWHSPNRGQDHAQALKTARQWLRAVERLPSIETPAVLPEHSEALPVKPTRAAKADKGDATAKIVAWLTKHHEYESGRVQNYNPAESREISEGSAVKRNTVSDFLKREFPGGERPRRGYVQACRNEWGLLHWFQRKHDDPMPQPNRKTLDH